MPAETAEAPDILFPELDDSNPLHKKLVAAAKAYNKAKTERAQLLSTAKEKEDGAMQKVIALMREAKLKKFKHKEVKAEIFETKEKVTVEIEEDDEEADDE